MTRIWVDLIREERDHPERGRWCGGCAVWRLAAGAWESDGERGVGDSPSPVRELDGERQVLDSPPTTRALDAAPAVADSPGPTPDIPGGAR